VYAKLAPGVDASKAFEAGTRLADWLASNRHGDGLVRPLAAFQELNVVFYPAVTGRPLSVDLRAPGPATKAVLRRAGELLKTLHGAPADIAKLLRDRCFDRELESVVRATAHIRLLLPDVGGVILELLERARSAYLATPAEASTVVHGDFKADHICATLAGVTLLDLDSCAVADPALDAGKLLADIDWWCGVWNVRPKAFQRAFLRAFTDHAQSALEIRSRAFEILMLIRIAAHRVPAFDPRWHARIKQFVDIAGRLMKRLEDDLGAS
jgi:hypothetical protein